MYTGDLNDIDETCVCLTNGSTSNRPSDIGSGIYPVVTIKGDATEYGWGAYSIKFQLLWINDANTHPYFRANYAGSWYSWLQL